MRGLKVSVYTGAAIDTDRGTDWSVVSLPGNELVPRLCGHLFHQACLGEWFRRANGDTCPLCREGFIGTDVSLSRTGGATMEHRSAYTLINCQNPPMLSTTRSTNCGVYGTREISGPQNPWRPEERSTSSFGTAIGQKIGQKRRGVGVEA